MFFRKKPRPGKFPAVIQSDHLGPLQLGQTEGARGPVHCYEATRPQTVPGHGPIKLVVRPPTSGVPDPAALAALVERLWATARGCIDRIIDGSEDVIAAAIETVWKNSDKTIPSAADLLRGELRQMNINLGEGSHELVIADTVGLIGGHNVYIRLSRNLEPTSARFGA